MVDRAVAPSVSPPARCISSCRVNPWVEQRRGAVGTPRRRSVAIDAVISQLRQTSSWRAPTQPSPGWSATLTLGLLPACPRHETNPTPANSRRQRHFSALAKAIDLQVRRLSAVNHRTARSTNGVFPDTWAFSTTSGSWLPAPRRYGRSSSK
jgi:hypothetical protein